MKMTSIADTSTSQVLESKLHTNIQEQTDANTTVKFMEGDLTSVPLYQAAILVWQIGLPLVIVTGTFGNLMIFLIQGRVSRGSDSSMSVYFISLAVADTFRLWFDPVFWWMEAAFNVNALAYDMATCKLRVLMDYMNGQVSAWILVTMTFQRAASIIWPHRVNVFCTRRFATVIMVMIYSAFLLVNAHILYGHITRRPEGNLTAGSCFFTYVNEDYAIFFQYSWGWMDTSLCALFPFVLLLVSNTILVRGVKQSLRDTKGSFTSGQSAHLHSRQKKVSSITLTLISISISFFILMTPVSVYMMLEDVFMRGANEDVNIAAANELALSVTSILWLGNSSVNFYIYCLTGARYREEFIGLLCGRCKQKKQDGSIGLSSTSIVSYQYEHRKT